MKLMTSKIKKITFIPDSERAEKILEPPSPAYKLVPEWFKSLSKYISDPKFSRYPSKDSGPSDTNFTSKACKPFFDSFTMGYLITLPTDVAIVDPNVYEARMFWDSNTNMADSHASVQVAGLDVPDEYEPAPYKWNFHWSIKVPKGYSLMFTHPFNRIELPFYTTTGIVESDQYEVPVNLPFFLKKNFIGVIPKGTPVAQVIPIKRESWEHEIKTHQEYNPYEAERIKLYLGGAYKKLFWQPKRYR